MKTMAYFSLFLFTSLACRERQPTEHSEQIGPVHVRHAFSSKSVHPWKVDMWLDATLYRVGEPIEVGFRATPLKPNERWHRPATKASLTITPASGGKPRNISQIVELQECQALPAGREIIYSEILDFPPKEFCWQATLEDVFHSSWRRNGKYLDPDRYAMDAEIALGETKVKFKRIHVDVEIRKPHR
ncbi:MAG: hypothetical protein FJ271_11030 [Planctomycetes bacterium]|nr:hypothetical protein [Planctomycetota bacterium]